MAAGDPPRVIDAGASADFLVRVEEQARFFFEDLLPRYIDRYFRGRGYRLIAEMLEAHDRGSIDALPAEPAPSERAKARALTVWARCPVAVSDLFASHGDQPALGEFVFVQLHMMDSAVSYHVAGEERVVWIHEASFRHFVEPERWDAEILFTLFHEYLHCLESFLPDRDQPLRGREERTPHRRFTPEEGYRADTRYIVRRRVLVGLALAIAIAIGVPFGASLRRSHAPAPIVERVTAAPTPPSREDGDQGRTQCKSTTSTRCKDPGTSSTATEQPADDGLSPGARSPWRGEGDAGYDGRRGGSTRVGVRGG